MGYSPAERSWDHVVRSGDERSMLLAFRTWQPLMRSADTFSSTLVGFSVVGFDLRIRDRYAVSDAATAGAARGDCEPLNPWSSDAAYQITAPSIFAGGVLALKTVLEHIGLGELASPIDARSSNLYKQKKYDKISALSGRCVRRVSGVGPDLGRGRADDKPPLSGT